MTQKRDFWETVKYLTPVLSLLPFLSVFPISWHLMMPGSAPIVSSCSRAWWRWACGPCQTSSFSIWSASGRWVSGGTSSPHSCISPWWAWTWRRTWCIAATAPISTLYSRAGSRADDLTWLLLTICMICMLCATTTEACTVDITQVTSKKCT